MELEKKKKQRREKPTFTLTNVIMFHRQNRGTLGSLSVQIVFAIVMSKAHNPIDFLACMMSLQTLRKIGKKEITTTLLDLESK